MNPLAAKVIGLVLALSVAFGAGFYTESRFVKANQVEAQKEVIREVATSIVDSNKQSVEIEAKVDQVKTVVKTITKVVVEHVKEVEKVNEAKCDPVNLRLDLYSVGMLNASRSADQPTPVLNDQSKAASTIGFPELVADELAITGQYNELAVRHNALVDYVQSEINKQAK